MKTDKFGQKIYSDDDVFHILMRTEYDGKPGPFLVEDSKQDINLTNDLIGYEAFVPYELRAETIRAFDARQQKIWWMPQEYKDLDIAAYILDLCNSNETELQRCGDELLLYQEKGLFDLLRYLKYIVDIMDEHNIVWGIGRGSSVASFVLYKLKVHRINSIYYDLDVREFLR